MTSDTTCVRCSRPMAEQAFACSNCAYRAGDQLHEIADMAPAARDVAHGFARRGGGGSSGKPGSRLPFDTMATEKLDKIQARLSTWVGVVAHGRNRPIPAPRHLGDDPIVLWSRWLAGHVDWLRHTDDAQRFLIEVGECAGVIRGVARGPSSQRYLGPCGAAVAWDDQGAEIARETPCEGDVYAHDEAKQGTCRTCKARWATANRRAWLDGEVRGHAFRAAEIGKAYSVNVNTIRSWAARQLLKSYFKTAAGIVADWVEPVEGEEPPPRLHYVGDVLDLAAADAARRATEQAKRARRTADREAAETEDAA